jgi:DNA-binding HxlR family transcriptional regulator
MGSGGDFCSFTKAVEHLGDRWSLLIVRELAMHGRLGFNALADGLPGISRSVLAARLRKLQELGLIARGPSVRSGQAPYQPAPAGEQLLPTLMSLRAWAEKWVPEDPSMAERDPDVIALWLSQRVDVARGPEPQAVIAFSIGQPLAAQTWLVVERGTPASICLEDPGLAESRYVYVEAEIGALYAISRGITAWHDAIAARSVQLFGEPELVRALPNWFLPAQAPATTEARELAVARRPVRADARAAAGRPRSARPPARNRHSETRHS